MTDRKAYYEEKITESWRGFQNKWHISNQDIKYHKLKAIRFYNNLQNSHMLLVQELLKKSRVWIMKLFQPEMKAN